MSILIKGIDMPKDYVLRIEIEPNGTVWEEGRDWIKHRQSAIQIDRPHGRLIDGGWVKYNLENYSDLPTKYLHMDLVREAIEDAPTILEAEE